MQSNENHGPRRNTYPILFDVILLWILVMGFLEKGKIFVDRKPREKDNGPCVACYLQTVNCELCEVVSRRMRSSRWNQPLFWIRRTRETRQYEKIVDEYQQGYHSGKVEKGGLGE